MKIKAETKELMPFFEILSDNLTDGVIQFKKDRLVVDEADPSNAYLIYVELKEEFFDVYEPEIEEHEPYRDGLQLNVGIYFNKFYPLLQQLDDGEDMALTLGPRTISAVQDDDVIQCNTIEKEVETVDTSNIELPTQFKLPSDVFIEKIDSASYFEDEPITFKPSEDELVMEAEAKTGSVRVSQDVKEFEGDNSTTYLASTFMEDLRMALKDLGIDDDLDINTGDSQPLEVEYENDVMSFKFYISPRIMEDEEV